MNLTSWFRFASYEISKSSAKPLTPYLFRFESIFSLRKVSKHAEYSRNTHSVYVFVFERQHYPVRPNIASSVLRCLMNPKWLSDKRQFCSKKLWSQPCKIDSKTFESFVLTDRGWWFFISYEELFLKIRVTYAVQKVSGKKPDEGQILKSSAEVQNIKLTLNLKNITGITDKLPPERRMEIFLFASTSVTGIMKMLVWFIVQDL